MASKDEALYTAAYGGRLPEVERLLADGASPDANGPRGPIPHYGAPALAAAAEKGHLEVVRALVRAGAKLEATDSTYGSTALMRAANNGKRDCVEFLLGA
eukprot:COSAG04_NODE_5258_length_1683_cov_1.279672_1_plen_99_part_10